MALSPLSDKSRADLINASKNIFDVQVGRSAFFKKSFLESRNWIALLCECDFKDDANRIAVACEKVFYVKAFCFNVDHPEDLAYSISLCRDDLFKVHEIYHAPSYAIIDQEERFVIVSDSDYYWSVAGSKYFIDQIAFPSIEEELSLFSKGIDSYIMSEDLHNKSIGRQMLTYLRICQDINNRA